jgi:hypothetical protein
MTCESEIKVFPGRNGKERRAGSCTREVCARARATLKVGSDCVKAPFCVRSGHWGSRFIACNVSLQSHGERPKESYQRKASPFEV